MMIDTLMMVSSFLLTAIPGLVYCLQSNRTDKKSTTQAINPDLTDDDLSWFAARGWDAATEYLSNRRARELQDQKEIAEARARYNANRWPKVLDSPPASGLTGVGSPYPAGGVTEMMAGRYNESLERAKARFDKDCAKHEAWMGNERILNGE